MEAIKEYARGAMYGLIGVIALIIFLLIVARITSFSRENKTRTEAAPSSGEFVKGMDVEMFIQQWGPKNGTAIILLHAAGGWSEVWRETGESLAKLGFHVIALDMPPLGYSERPDTPRYSREDQAKRIIGVMNSLRIDKAVLVGHSFGGRAVAQAALQYPQRVKALVLVDAALSFKEPGTRPPLLTRALLAFGPMRDALAASTFTNPIFTHTLLKMFVANPTSASSYWVSVYQTPLSVTGTTKAIGDWLPQLLAEEDASLSSVPEAYAKIKVPALVLWGGDDHTTPLADGEYLATLIPGSRLEVMPGLGHLPPLEDTSAFDEKLYEFLKTI